MVCAGCPVQLACVLPICASKFPMTCGMFSCPLQLACVFQSCASMFPITCGVFGCPVQLACVLQMCVMALKVCCERRLQALEGRGEIMESASSWYGSSVAPLLPLRHESCKWQWTVNDGKGAMRMWWPGQWHKETNCPCRCPASKVCPS